MDAPHPTRKDVKVFASTRILSLVAKGQLHNLTKAERLILPVMATHADHDTGDGVLSIGSIARMTGISRNTASHAYRRLVHRCIIQDDGYEPGHGVTWRIINIPDRLPNRPNLTPPDTPKNCAPVLIDKKECTGTYKIGIGTCESKPKNQKKSPSQNTRKQTDSFEDRDFPEKHPSWWVDLAERLSIDQEKPEAYQKGVLKKWGSKGSAEIDFKSVGSLEEAEQLMGLRNSYDNRQRWLEAVQVEMEKDKKPGGSRGHLVWVAQYVVCERCTPRVVLFRLEGHDDGARQWGPLLLGLLRRLTKEWGSPSLVLKNDGWRQEYAASQRQATARRSAQRQASPPPAAPQSAAEAPPEAPDVGVVSEDAHNAWQRVTTRLQQIMQPERYYESIVPLEVYHADGDTLWLTCTDAEVLREAEPVCQRRITDMLWECTGYEIVRFCANGVVSGECAAT